VVLCVADRAADPARRPPINRRVGAAINAYVAARNADPKPFRWVKSADDILASIDRFCRRTINVQSQSE
jgi:hypothetical protein